MTRWDPDLKYQATTRDRLLVTVAEISAPLLKRRWWSGLIVGVVIGALLMWAVWMVTIVRSV